jgi:hypothetical protein
MNILLISLFQCVIFVQLIWICRLFFFAEFFCTLQNPFIFLLCTFCTIIPIAGYILIITTGDLMSCGKQSYLYCNKIL